MLHAHRRSLRSFLAGDQEEVEEEEEEGEDEAAKYTCDTDEGIKECLKEWMSSDAFLNCSDPFAVQLGDVVDFCAFLCDVTGVDKEAWCKTHKQSILPHWKACDTCPAVKKAAQTALDEVDSQAMYSPDKPETNWTKRFEDKDKFVIVDQCAQPELYLSEFGLLMYDNHDTMTRTHLLAKHKENGATKGSLAHGLPCWLRKYPKTQYFMVFMEGDLQPDEVNLEESTRGGLKIVKAATCEAAEADEEESRPARHGASGSSTSRKGGWWQTRQIVWRWGTC